MRRLLLHVALLATLLVPATVAAQRASGFVPPAHWSLRALDRLHALGLAPAGTHRGERSRTIAEVHAALTAAATRDGGGAEGDVASAQPERVLARQWLHAFEREFPALVLADGVRLGHAHASGGAGVLDGDVRPGRYTDFGEENWTGAIARGDRTRLAGGAGFSLELGRHLAVGGSARGGPDRTRIEEGYATAAFGPVGLWGGRRLQGYGPGSHGVVLNAAAPADGGGLMLQPVRVPVLGAIRMDLSLARLPANGPVSEPWLLVTRGSAEPHPRFGVGVTRAAMAGGFGGESFDAQDVLYLLIGKHVEGSQYDNQVVSVDGWLRPPLGTLPLLLYLEWGFEDSAGAWRDVPGIVAGAELPAVPGAAWLALRTEHTRFGGSSAGNPPWYRHPIGFHEGWTAKGQLLGHPLGGHGQEWLVEAAGSLRDAQVQLATRGFTRRRDTENVFAPERLGRSYGAELEADVTLARCAALRLTTSHENGREWSRTSAEALLRLYVPR